MAKDKEKVNVGALARALAPEYKKSESAYRCPKCGSDNLGVVQCTVNGDMDLSDDGFLISGDTSEETVECRECGHQGPMAEFDRDA